MKRLALLAILIVAGWAGAASAQQFIGYATVNANLRAGPDVGYPRVSAVPSGAQLQIFGCLDSWSWCDVQWGPERGWMSAGLIASDFGGSRVIVYDNGPRLGLPFVTFALDVYWRNYYGQRSWYRDRGRWDHYRPPYRPARPPGYRPPQRPRPPVHRPPTHRPTPTRPPQHVRPPTTRPPAHARPPQRVTRPAAHTRPPPKRDNDRH
jgi:uncharacterized protein YraI